MCTPKDFGLHCQGIHLNISQILMCNLCWIRSRVLALNYKYYADSIFLDMAVAEAESGDTFMSVFAMVYVQSNVEFREDGIPQDIQESNQRVGYGQHGNPVAGR